MSILTSVWSTCTSLQSASIPSGSIKPNDLFAYDSNKLSIRSNCFVVDFFGSVRREESTSEEVIGGAAFLLGRGIFANCAIKTLRDPIESIRNCC
uniref:Uncharacterized protein n=1 Tax=Glycine max TaxID=3847 RepID=C6TIZ3_SOYBN|nr:unknown [Glycine max]